MIVSFRDKATERLYRGERVAQFEPFRRQEEKRLRVLESAEHLLALTRLPSNRFEALKGDRKGQYSIRINEQWRLCFRWAEADAGPSDVEIVDYHR
ncbi:MAG: plasmid maintenance system killer protein [Alphaproteobacteria bacterium]|nr:plasmid maintenance system killer protein [Alphaproteobacteria bacterium]